MPLFDILNTSLCDSDVSTKAGQVQDDDPPLLEEEELLELPELLELELPLLEPELLDELLLVPGGGWSCVVGAAEPPPPPQPARRPAIAAVTRIFMWFPPAESLQVARRPHLHKSAVAHPGSPFLPVPEACTE